MARRARSDFADGRFRATAREVALARREDLRLAETEDRRAARNAASGSTTQTRPGTTTQTTPMSTTEPVRGASAVWTLSIIGCYVAG